MILYANKGKYPFQIDDKDNEVVSLFSWSLKDGYPYTSIQVIETIYVDGQPKQKWSRKRISLHNFLMGRASSGLEWDHKNRDKLDNRRENLRLVTKVVNSRNRAAKGISGVPGVDKAGSKWRVDITTDEGRIRFGRFNTLEEAIAVRLAAEEKYWGNNK